MTIEDYKKNLRGVNNDSDFSPEFLVRPTKALSTYRLTIVQQNIYDSIRKREIVMPEEHTGQLGFEFAWKELLARTRHAGMLVFPMSHQLLFIAGRRIHYVQHISL